MFPAANELKNRPADGQYLTYLKYSTFQNEFVSLCQNLFGKSQKWGTHTLRKSGYLFAIWGGGTVELIMMSARHKDLLSAQKYVGDANIQLEVTRRNRRSLAGLISNWVPILIVHASQNRNLNENHLQGTIYAAANYFCQELLGVNTKV